MSVTGQSFWPEDIDVGTLSPREILDLQVAPLAEITKGLVTAEITESVDEEGKVFLQMSLVAPGLENYRREILTIRYGRELPYPADVDADCFRGIPRFQIKETIEDALGRTWPRAEPRAVTDRELEMLVKVALRSSAVKALLASLIARSKEALRAGGREVPR